MLVFNAISLCHILCFLIQYLLKSWWPYIFILTWPSLCHCDTVSLCHFPTMTICWYILSDIDTILLIYDTLSLYMSLWYYITISVRLYLYFICITLSFWNYINMTVCPNIAKTVSEYHYITIIVSHFVTISLSVCVRP